MNERQTIFSSDRKYRYTLWRNLRANPIDDRFKSDGKYVMFVGLNPSTADEVIDDPTIRRCIAFTKRWGYDELCMTNLFAFRATDPMVMRAEKDPTGPDNDKWMAEVATGAALIVAAWGAHGSFKGRADEVRARAAFGGAVLHCLGTTKDGQPKHPLYLRADTQLQLWKSQAS